MSLLQDLVKFKIFFLKVEHEGELQILNLNYSTQVMLMKIRIMKKAIPYYKLGNHQILTISGLIWIVIWRN